MHCNQNMWKIPRPDQRMRTQMGRIQHTRLKSELETQNLTIAATRTHHSAMRSAMPVSQRFAHTWAFMHTIRMNAFLLECRPQASVELQV